MKKKKKILWSDRLEEMYLETHEKPKLVNMLDNEKENLYFPNCKDFVPTKSYLYNIVKKYIYRHIDKENKQFIGYNKSGPYYKAVIEKKITPKNQENMGKVITSGRTIKENGEKSFDGKVLLRKDEELTCEDVLAAYNLDEKRWTITNFQLNNWEMQGKNGEPVQMWQFKIIVKPRQNELVSVYDALDEYFAEKEFVHEREPLKPFTANKSDNLLEINYTDAHLGLYADGDQAGKPFDIEIAKETFKTAIENVIEKAESKKFDKVRFVTIGDILHTDNSKNTTSAGTFQDVSCMFGEAVFTATDMLVEGIERLLDLGVPVEYVYVQGNHDGDVGYEVANAIRLAFRHEPNVEVDISKNPHKVKVWGNSLIGYTHGNMNKQNKEEWITKMYPAEYATAKYREVHCGHLHNEHVTYNATGILVKQLPALCRSSAWEHRMGYCSQSALFCQVWNKRRGLDETWVFNF